VAMPLLFVKLGEYCGGWLKMQDRGATCRTICLLAREM